MSFTNYPYYVCILILLIAAVFVQRERRWILLLGFSLLFYGMGRWGYLLLLLASVSIDYFCALRIEANNVLTRRRLYLWVSITANLSILIFFKYLGVLYGDWDWVEVRSASEVLQIENLILPLGISFYTLQSMGYTIDVYRREVKAERHFGFFSLYVSFFPQLVAGPIERAKNLLPQLRAPADISIGKIQSGLYLIVLGLAKKLIIADRLFVLLTDALQRGDQILGWQAMSFGTLMCFAIYMDLSAYTDIARGSARIFGIELSLNFRRPMLARSLGEYWERWHMSLSSWIQNYLYRSLVPLSSAGWYRYLTLIFTFTVIGLWHGPTGPFVLLGVLHGCIIALERLNARRGITWPNRPWINRVRILRTHIIYNISGTLFLAPTLDAAWDVYRSMFFYTEFWSDSAGVGGESYTKLGLLVFFGLLGLAILETLREGKWHQYLRSAPVWGHFVLLYAFFFGVLTLSYDSSLNDFFYFNF